MCRAVYEQAHKQLSGDESCRYDISSRAARSHMQDEHPDEPLLVKFFSVTWPMKNKSVSRGLLGPEIPAKMEAVEAGSCRGRLIDAYVQRELSPSEAGALKIVSLHLQSDGEGRVCARAYVGAESRDADIIHPAERRFRWHPD
jgi:hypothetical protein